MIAAGPNGWNDQYCLINTVCFLPRVSEVHPNHHIVSFNAQGTQSKTSHPWVLARKCRGSQSLRRQVWAPAPAAPAYSSFIACWIPAAANSDSRRASQPRPPKPGPPTTSAVLSGLLLLPGHRRVYVSRRILFPPQVALEARPGGRRAARIRQAELVPAVRRLEDVSVPLNVSSCSEMQACFKARRALGVIHLAIASRKRDLYSLGLVTVGRLRPPPAKPRSLIQLSSFLSHV